MQTSRPSAAALPANPSLGSHLSRDDRHLVTSWLAECTYALQTAPDGASREQRFKDRVRMLSQLGFAYGPDGRVQSLWDSFQSDAQEVLREAALTQKLSTDDLIALHHVRSQPGVALPRALRPEGVSPSQLDAVVDAFQTRVGEPRTAREATPVVPAPPAPRPLDAQWTAFVERLAPPLAQRPEGSVVAVVLEGASKLEDLRTLQKLTLADTALVRIDAPERAGLEQPPPAALLAHLGLEPSALGSRYAQLLAPLLKQHEGNPALLLAAFLRMAMGVELILKNTFQGRQIVSAGERWERAVEAGKTLPVGKLTRIAADCAFQMPKVRHLERYEERSAAGGPSTRSLFVEVHTPRAQYHAWRHTAELMVEATAAMMRHLADPRIPELSFSLRDRKGRTDLSRADVTGKHELVALQGKTPLASVQIRSLIDDALSCDELLALYPLDAPLAQNALPAQPLV